MTFDKDITIAFSGHRTYRGEAGDELRCAVQELYDRGYIRFLCGMAWGFDLSAGEAVAALRQEHPEVKLVAVLPFKSFHRLFSGDDAERFRRLASVADEVVVVSSSDNKASFRMRNDFLVDNASCLVAWYDGGTKGGTAYTVKRARRKGLLVENLYPLPQLELEF
ncbi:MAG: DUF1273 family protein [Alistipes sp.]|nr:DUF1273 family protein [Alistipes sp.]